MSQRNTRTQRDAAHASYHAPNIPVNPIHTETSKFPSFTNTKRPADPAAAAAVAKAKAAAGISAVRNGNCRTDGHYLPKRTFWQRFQYGVILPLCMMPGSIDAPAMPQGRPMETCMRCGREVQRN
ncbi:uncharacterized protein EHS24_004222 [Apiotrichum porosum]|uniref:Uncharacterized protein n=1 Tax=Apiotrichum porosum TaxID=105984 RepID=A0A427Y4L9_9TREE|nr:uncharacterized protein EHS24_004222 [Apiotrichum porosum]RSH86023.1 hypothetical protein EHS24_004222 [Apiotrichum porosum]